MALMTTSREALDAGRQLWKPTRVKRRDVSLRVLVRDLTNQGELVIEFAVRVLLGQDLRLAQDWAPLLKASKVRPRANMRVPVARKQEAKERLKKLRAALGALPDPPEISMDDRRWAAQFLMAYGWGTPPRMETIGDDDAPVRPQMSVLAIRAAEIVEEFQPQGVEEEARLARILAVISEPKRPMTMVRTETGEYVPPLSAPTRLPS